MCRLCGRMVKCIFDNMPSRAPSIRTLLKQTRPNSTLASIAHAKTGTLPPQASLSSTIISPPAPVPAATPIQTFSAATATPAAPPTLTKPLVLSKSLQQLLPHLTAQTPHYIQTHIHRFPYLLTTGDTLRLPFVLHGVAPGDILRFNRASLLGSRDYTLKAGVAHSTETRAGEPNYIDERLFECRMRVMGVESGPMTTKEKTKRRNRKVKTVRSKHRYTVLRCVGVRVRGVDELRTDPAVQIILE